MIVRFFSWTTFPGAPFEFCFLHQVRYFFKSSVLYCVSAREKFVVDKAKRLRDIKENIFQVA